MGAVTFNYITQLVKGIVQGHVDHAWPCTKRTLSPLNILKQSCHACMHGIWMLNRCPGTIYKTQYPNDRAWFPKYLFKYLTFSTQPAEPGGPCSPLAVADKSLSLTECFIGW